MTAEVVVVIQDQHLCLGTGSFAEVVCGCEPADASTDDHQIIALAGVVDLTCVLPEGAVPDSVGDFKRSGMTSSQAGACWRIIVSARHFKCGENMGRHQSRSHADGYSVEEIAAGDVAVQSQIFLW